MISALNRLAEAAMLAGRPPPVIRTDMVTAMEIRQAVCEELGSQLAFKRHGPLVFMFNGVAIMADRSPREGDGFRAHFGELADILQ